MLDTPTSKPSAVTEVAGPVAIESPTKAPRKAPIAAVAAVATKPVVGKKTVRASAVAVVAAQVAKPAASKQRAAAKPVATKPVATKPVAIKKPPKARPAVAAPAATKAKLVRDSFTMPQQDFNLIAVLKDRALAFRRPTKKSELLRAGLQVLEGLPTESLQSALERLAPLKTGRPKKTG